jgi:tape measure domain-containing protein
MAAVTTELKVLVKVAGDKGLDRLSRSLTNIGKQAQASSVKFDQVAKRLQQVQQNSNNSIASLRNYRNAWRDIAEQVDIGSKEFKQATEEAKKLDAQIQKAQGRRQRGGGGLGGAAQIAGTVAGAGVFGGAEGAIGAALGAFAGPQGAIVGGAIGAQVGQLREALGATAEYAASLQKLRIALFGVTTSQEEYGEALKFVAETTKTFAIPQDVVTRQFTKLQASVQGAGGSIEDTKIAFNGIVAAVRATGGSLADVDAALTATAQVFSKGKVSAEELRQQIGERLPGAFTLFAESIGKTPQQLDKALEDGQVSLQDFQTFAEAIFKRYGETAQEIANGPESAGDRLSVVLQELNAEVGNLLAPIGAAFQETFITIAQAIIKATRALANFFKIGDRAVIEQNTILIQATNKSIASLRKTVRDYKAETGPDPLGIRAGLIAEQERTIAELEGKRARLRTEINRATRTETPDVAQTAPGRGLPGITPSAGGGGAARSAERARERALEKAIQLEEKLNREIRDTAFANTRVAETAREAIENQFTISLQKAIDKHTDLNRVVKDLEKEAGTTFPQLTALVEELNQGLLKVAATEQDFALFNLRLEEIGMNLNNFRELTNKLQESFATGDGADGNLFFNVGADVLNRQGEAIDKLLDKYPQLGEVANATAELMTSGFQSVAEGAKSAQQVFADFLKSIAQTLLQTAQQMIAQYIAIGIARMFAIPSTGNFDLSKTFGGFGGDPSSALGGLSFTNLGGFQFANGGVFAKNKIVPFAYGGIVNKPTLFPMANGAGLMGEAGPEAIMPLRRTASGRLGVEATGGTSNIVVNVDASGTRVQGDDTRGKQLGGAISAAVQAELIKQRRPGGLLAS